MYLTEEEAKEEWCPEYRTNDPVSNRAEWDSGVRGGCLGSRCAQWRWLYYFIEEKPLREMTDAELVDPPSCLAVKTNRGYCGKGGVPSQPMVKIEEETITIKEDQ